MWGWSFLGDLFSFRVESLSRPVSKKTLCDLMLWVLGMKTVGPIDGSISWRATKNVNSIGSPAGSFAEFVSVWSSPAMMKTTFSLSTLSISHDSWQWSWARLDICVSKLWSLTPMSWSWQATLHPPVHNLGNIHRESSLFLIMTEQTSRQSWRSSWLFRPLHLASHCADWIVDLRSISIKLILDTWWIRKLVMKKLNVVENILEWITN